MEQMKATVIRHEAAPESSHMVTPIWENVAELALQLSLTMLRVGRPPGL